MTNAAAETEGQRPRTNAELREEATRRMVQTAIRLIAERGASKLSLVDVGRESGYSHSLPNYYFKSKKGLLLEVYAFIIGRAMIRIREWARTHIPERIRPGMSNIRATIRGYLGLAYTDPTASRAMHILWSESISSMPELHKVVQPWNRRTVTFFEEEIRVGIRRGEIDPAVDVESLALLLVAMLRGAVAQYMVDPERVNLERLADAIVALLDRGIAPPPKRS